MICEDMVKYMMFDVFKAGIIMTIAWHSHKKITMRK